MVTNMLKSYLTKTLEIIIKTKSPNIGAFNYSTIKQLYFVANKSIELAELYTIIANVKLSAIGACEQFITRFKPLYKIYTKNAARHVNNMPDKTKYSNVIVYFILLEISLRKTIIKSIFYKIYCKLKDEVS